MYYCLWICYINVHFNYVLLLNSWWVLLKAFVFNIPHTIPYKNRNQNVHTQLHFLNSISLDLCYNFIELEKGMKRIKHENINLYMMVKYLTFKSLILSVLLLAISLNKLCSFIMIIYFAVWFLLYACLYWVYFVKYFCNTIFI